jgi:hypothetical protein
MKVLWSEALRLISDQGVCFHSGDSGMNGVSGVVALHRTTTEGLKV